MFNYISGSIELSWITNVSENIDKYQFDVICQDSRTFSFKADMYASCLLLFGLDFIYLNLFLRINNLNFV